jgi:lipopolysaccharide transport system ATP-binding protein
MEFEVVMGLANWFSHQSRSYSLQHPIIFLSNYFHFHLRRRPYIIFVVIRDLRDALVSHYFSMKISHPELTERHRKWRHQLNISDKEQGLLFLMEGSWHRWANAQLSWRNTPDILLVKYEDLVADEHATFEQIIDHCHLEVDRTRLHEIVRYNSFEVMTGRKRGQEDVNSHQRKGIVGDWRNHFSESVKEEFKRQFGDVLIKTGYERDLNW